MGELRLSRNCDRILGETGLYIKRADEQRNGLLPTKGVDNRRIAAYHVINFIAIFWIETCSLGRAKSLMNYSNPSIDSCWEMLARCARLLWIEILKKNCLFAEYRTSYLCSTRQLFPRKPLLYNRKFRENNGKFLSLNRDKRNKKRGKKRKETIAIQWMSFVALQSEIHLILFLLA